MTNCGGVFGILLHTLHNSLERELVVFGIIRNSHDHSGKLYFQAGFCGGLEGLACKMQP